MKNKSVGKYVTLAVFGFVMLVVGLVLAKLLPDTQSNMLILPYILVGVGAGIFGENFGTAIKNQLLKKDPNAAKQLEIDAKDERNIAISNRAKAKAYDLMLMAYSALILAFALMRVDIYVVLALVVVYLFVVFSMVFYIKKYREDM